MICDVSTVLRESGEKIPIDGFISSFGEEKDSEPVLADVHVTGDITNIGDALELRAKARGIFYCSCARCTRRIKRDFCTEFTEVLVNADNEISDMDDVVIFGGYTIDLTEIVRNNILISLPIRFLCDEDCKGICPTCGADLNEESCKCSKDYIDPRLESLRKLLE